MTQTQHPTYGELITDLSLARAIPGGPGLYEGGWPRVNAGKVYLDPGPRGVVAWRTDSGVVGDKLIVESGAIEVTLPAAPSGSNRRVDLVIGEYEWVAGLHNWASGVPLGTLTASQLATYSILKGAEVAYDGTALPPTVSVPYSGNRRGVALARINWAGSSVESVEPWDPNDHRPERRAGQVTFAEYAYISSSWQIATFGTHPDVSYKNGNSNLKVQRSGYYQMSVTVANAAADVSVIGFGSTYTAKASLTVNGYLKAGTNLSAICSDTASNIVATLVWLGYNLNTPVSGQLSTFLIQTGDIGLPYWLGTITAIPTTAAISLVHDGGRDPVTWSITGGTVPNKRIEGGNQLKGDISGHGTWTVSVQATDTLGRTATKTMTWIYGPMTGGTQPRLLGNPPTTWPYVVDVNLNGGVDTPFGAITLSNATVTRGFGLAYTPTWKAGSDQVSVALVGQTTARLTLPMEYPATYVDGGGVTRDGGFWEVTVTATDLSGASVTVIWQVGFNQV